MSLHPATPAQYPQLRQLITPECCGAVYPLSVLGGAQSGAVYTDETGRAALIHHCCGFAFLCGEYDAGICRGLAEKLHDPAPYARMILFAPDAQTADFFRSQAGYAVERRLFYRYPANSAPRKTHASARITADILRKISGKITPAFSWPEDADFLKRGSGFCVLQEGLPAAWAFSAAVSENEVDIGVETDERFRRRGFAFAAAAAMIADTLSHGKTPVRACHAGNSGSQKLAEALGFVRCGECETVRVTA
jgi:GNAT superfamily N-acetyltransferase